MKIELTPEERDLLFHALDKKLWSLHHVGLPDEDQRVAPYVALRLRFSMDVHTQHCCAEHGCKYGNDDCPVETGAKFQSYPCEQCEDAQEEEIELLTRLLEQAQRK